ncbi:hypothetical protein XELAEV_18031044mg [Xenopus laevis]|uniref:Uncharacterized protein n=1 Tax=Xenopus laevis TaxID=8355 RepID=A0A974HFA5_XENLA|nr:hypothetical protein XELAEV_18031044mg [Xenopus laevis]
MFSFEVLLFHTEKCYLFSRPSVPVLPGLFLFTVKTAEHIIIIGMTSYSFHLQVQWPWGGGDEIFRTVKNPAKFLLDYSIQQSLTCIKMLNYGGSCSQGLHTL